MVPMHSWPTEGALHEPLPRSAGFQPAVSQTFSLLALMNTTRKVVETQGHLTQLLLRSFGAVFGAFLGLALLKFGNPPIMERFVTAPANVWEFVFNSPWPIAWAYWALVG